MSRDMGWGGESERTPTLRAADAADDAGAAAVAAALVGAAAEQQAPAAEAPLGRLERGINDSVTQDH